ncbi:MAG: phospholipase D-like domain-containing protein [Anaerolineales bacterium]
MTKKRQSNKTSQKGLLIVLTAVLALGLLFTLTGADPLGLFTDAPTATQPPTPTTRAASVPSASGDDWYEVMFVNPIRMTNAEKEEYSTNGLPPEIMAGSIAERLIYYIDSAQTSIHVAAFEFNLTDIANAVIRAHQRGVDVRWITDDEFGIEADEKPGHGQIATMKKAGISIIDDSRTGLMHHKFWVFDGKIVWTGSTNATINGMFEQDNNVIVIKSPELASIYETQFEEMWGGEFGARAPSFVEEQSVVVNGTRMLVLFSPEDRPVQYMLPFLENARRNIRFMAFSFTQPDIGNAMLGRIQSGITVEGIFERVGSDSQFSEMMKLHCGGGNIRRDGNPGFLHHKIIIVDNRIVITGSFNFSDSANTRNNENVIIIDNADIARLYLGEFQRIWSGGSDLDPDRFVCP